MVWLKIRKNDIRDEDTEVSTTVVVWLKIRKNDIWKVKSKIWRHVVVWLKIRKNDIFGTFFGLPHMLWFD